MKIPVKDPIELGKMIEKIDPKIKSSYTELFEYLDILSNRVRELEGLCGQITHQIKSCGL